VGGGFSGAMLAVHLLHQSSSLSVAVIDPGSLPGRGVAYSSPRKFHLLNVPAGEMSAFPDAPDDFLRWARIHFDAGMRERSFPPRSVYGAYLGNLFEKARFEAGEERLQWIRDRVLSLRHFKGGLAIQTEQGPEILARVVVLATGNFPPANPRVPGLDLPRGAYFQFPWSPEALENLPPASCSWVQDSPASTSSWLSNRRASGVRFTSYHARDSFLTPGDKCVRLSRGRYSGTSDRRAPCVACCD